tara:strand:+ start:236 stop:679 length:444 start_codon:yes stop_codon:yes gene_type:complete
MPKRLISSPRKMMSAPRISIRARKLTSLTRPELPPIQNVPGLNIPESRIYKALKELKIRFEIQRNVLGGGILGGAKADFLLPDYMIDLEYQGPFHGVAEGKARDVLRNLGVTSKGYRVVQLYERDLKRLVPRILELIGKPSMVGVGT